MKKKIQIVGYVISALSLCFVIKKISGMDIYFNAFQDKLGRLVLLCLCSLLICMAAFVLLSFGWSYMISAFSDDKKCVKNGMSVYLKANMAKYIPGSVFQYIQRNLFLEKVHVSGSDAAACSLTEIVSLLISGLLISILFLRERIFGLFSMLKEYNTNIVLIAALAAILILVLLFLFFKQKIIMTVKKLFADGFLSKFLIELFVTLAALLLIALSYFPLILLFPEIDLSFELFCFLTGALTGSWLSGYIIIGAPGGIGVKELAFSLLVSVSPYSDAFILLLVFHRFISILSDIILWLISFLRRK